MSFTMRMFKGYHLALIAILLVSPVIASDQSTDPVRVNASPKIKSDASEPSQPIEATSDNEEILKRWKEGASNSRLASGTYTRSEFKHAFCTERLTTGRFMIESPSRWRFDEKAVKVRRHAVSDRTDTRTGQRYHLETGETVTWIFTGELVAILRPDDKTAFTETIPLDKRGKFQCPLSAMFFTDAEECERLFEMKTLRGNDEVLTMLAIPKTTKDDTNSWWNFNLFQFLDAAACEKAAFSLNRITARPTAVRRRDGSGNTENFYRFDTLDFKSRDDDRITPDESDAVFNEHTLDGYRVYP